MNLDEERVVVTGGLGFIGSHLVERLVERSTGSILVLDNLHRPCIDPRAWRGKVEFAQVDIRDRAAVRRALTDCGVVFHLAAQSNVIAAAADAGYAFDTNVAGTFNVLEAAKAARIRRVVFTSSREIYGEPEELPVAESSPLAPQNAYGVSKAAAEMYCRLAAAEGIEVAVLRLANVYGPRDRDRVIPLFLSAARAGLPLEIYGGDQVIDFVWIGVVVDALLQAGFGAWLREPVNIGSGKGTTLPELAESITQMTGSPAPIRIVPKRKVEVRRFIADTTRACGVLRLDFPPEPLAYLPALLEPAAEAHASPR